MQSHRRRPTEFSKARLEFSNEICLASRPLWVILLSLFNLRGSLLRWRMDFVQLSVEPLSPVLLRGQKSSRKSQRLISRARMSTVVCFARVQEGYAPATRAGNTDVCLPKRISTSMKDLKDSTASSAEQELGSVAGGMETQEH